MNALLPPPAPPSSSPPNLAGINQNARILRGWRLEMQRYMKCFQFAFSQITSFALKGKLVFFDYDDAHQFLTAHLGEQEKARGTRIWGEAHLTAMTKTTGESLFLEF